MTKTKSPPVAKPLFSIDASFTNFGDYIVELNQAYGSIVRFSYLFKWFVVNDIDAIKHILLDNRDNYTKDSGGYKRMRHLFGQGLLTTNSTSIWLRQRKVLASAFQKKHLSYFSDVISTRLTGLIQELKQYANNNKPCNLSLLINRFVLQVAGEALFSYQLSTVELDNIIENLATCSAYMVNGLAPGLWLPSIGNLKFHIAKHKLYNDIKKIINHHNGSNPRDLLSILKNAQTKDASITDQQIVDEVFTFLMTGHETTGNLILWVLWCLQANPDCLDKLRNELANSNDDNELDYLTQVINETLRLYPPIWHFARTASMKDELGGYKIPAKSTLIICPYSLHRNPEIWPEPEVFNPERFADGDNQFNQRFHFLPFGYGSRICIASNMAMLQAKLVLATILKNVDIKILGHQYVKPEFYITLHPKDHLQALISLYNKDLS